MAEQESFGDDLHITLKKPIDGPTGAVTSIALREPTAGEILEWDKLQGVEADIKAITIISGQPDVVIRKLVATDFYKAARFIGHFLA